MSFNAPLVWDFENMSIISLVATSCRIPASVPLSKLSSIPPIHKSETLPSNSTQASAWTPMSIQHYLTIYLPPPQSCRLYSLPLSIVPTRLTLFRMSATVCVMSVMRI